MIQLINFPWVRVLLAVLGVLFLALLVLNNLIADFFLQYLVLYKYTALALVVFLGGLCIPLPANVFLLAVGALSAAGEFNFTIAVVVATGANVAGNLIAHSFFRQYGRDILRDEFVREYSFFIGLENFFRKYTSIAIFISRIIGLLGTPVNFLSGYFRVPHWQFTLFDILGNLTYALLFLGLGLWVGERWVAVSEFMNIFMNVLAVIMIVLIATLLYRTRSQVKI